MSQYLGIEVSKPIVAVGLVDDRQAVSFRKQEPTKLVEGADAILQQASRMAHEVMAESGRTPRRGGVGLSAFINPETGTVITSGFIPEWKSLDVRKLFAKATGLPISVTNNVRAAALGEAVHGAGKGKRVVSYCTISTGFGMATVVDGKLWRGARELAGQVGFSKLGGDKDLNQLLSGSGLSASGSSIFGSPVTSEKIFELAAKDHPAASKLIAAATDALAATIAWIQATIDPDVIVFGGGVALSHPEFVREATERSLQHLGTPHRDILGGPPEVTFAKFGQDAGLIGAATLAKQDADTSK